MSESPSDLPPESGSNLRPVSLEMAPDMPRQMASSLRKLGLIDSIRHARVVHVPILPIKLVNMPRRSEDPRLARANDDGDRRA
ncbi:MAG: hypothetical protein KGJ57_18345 [Sphingomonadales bacterium]|nr:hypothetical protein [Sphingomonadales bacterium]MDE2171360.1 hypothetical protein [Sphingomonadales bacterium]